MQPAVSELGDENKKMPHKQNEIASVLATPSFLHQHMSQEGSCPVNRKEIFGIGEEPPTVIDWSPCPVSSHRPVRRLVSLCVVTHTKKPPFSMLPARLAFTLPLAALSFAPPPPLVLIDRRSQQLTVSQLPEDPTPSAASRAKWGVAATKTFKQARIKWQ